MITPQFSLDLNAELIVDNFAGGGGASTGIELATGRHVDHAINHCREALGMHRINHPQTIHHCEDIFDVDPCTVCEGRPVGLAHFSPDCKHHSKAKGGKPLDKKIRGLVVVMLRWAKYGARVMTMENVEEIEDWGPLIWECRNGKWGWYPDRRFAGRTWQAFLACLSTGIDPAHPDLPEILEVLAGTVTRAECVRGFGYRFEYRQLCACDYGTPTIRKRLFLVARRDGRPIVWPAPTHFQAPTRGGKPWRTIAQCIDWERPCPSIFDDTATIKARYGVQTVRPLAPATLSRIAKGIDRYVLKAKEPFLVSLTHQGGERTEPTSEPARTVTGAHRGEKALVVSRFNGSHAGRADGATRNRSPKQPLSVQDTSNRFGLTEASLAPFLTEHANASHQRNHAAKEPMRTTCAEVKGGHFALVSANVMVNTTGHPGSAASGPAPTATTGEQQSLVTGTLVGAGGPAYSGEPKRVTGPMHTQTAKTTTALASATLVHTAHGEADKNGRRRGRGARDVRESMPTTTASPDCAIAAASMVKLRGTNVGHHPQEPGHVVSAGGQHHGVVAASVIRHFGESVGQPADSPAPTTVAGGGGKTGVLAAHLTKFNTGSVGSPMREPGPTVTSGSHRPETHGGAGGTQGMAVAYLAQHNGGFNENPGHPATDPVSAISSKGSQQQVVAASVAAYFGSEADGQAVTEGCRTISTKPRSALVESTVAVPMTPEQRAGALQVAAFLREHGVRFEGEFATVEGYVIVDIGMRMLTPRELFRAQGFGNRYVIDRAWVVDPATGAVVEVRLTKEQQIRMCGNSVCPQVMAAIVRANAPELAVHSRRAHERALQESEVAA